MSAGAAALAALAVLLAAPAAAPAAAVSEGELRSLAARAEGDPSARAALARVDRVGGRPVAVRALVAGARPDEIRARIELALDSAAASGAPRDSAAGSREAARDVLDDRRYTGTQVPRPFTGVLRWLGDRLRPARDLVEDVADAIPGGPVTLWLVAAVLVSGAAIALARRSIRRTARGAGGRVARAGRERPEDPRALEAQADRAEAEGDWQAAVRLRFRAGLLRLAAEDVLPYRPSLTTGEVSRALQSPAFDRVGRDFDAIAYGGRGARAEDAAAAREGWREILETPARR